MVKIEDWCGTELWWISDAYRQVHGYVSITICLIGIVGNVLNIVIFGQKKNAASPVNIILRWLSTIDLIVLIIVIPFNWISFVHKSTDVQAHSYGRSVALWYYQFVTQTLHTIGIWLTVMLATWRYIAIAYPLQKKYWCNASSTRRVTLAGCGICTLLCTPLLYTFRIRTHDVITNQFGFLDKEGNLTRLYSLGTKEPADVVVFFNFVAYTVLLRLVPSILMILLSLKLISRLTKTKKIRRQLTTVNTERSERQTERSERQMDRISTMILAVLLVFLLNEIPQTVLILLVLVYGQQVFYLCYNPMGEILDLLGLVNSSLHFFLYYAISRQFRISFERIAPRRWRRSSEKTIFSSCSGANEKSFSSREAVHPTEFP